MGLVLEWKDETETKPSAGILSRTLYPGKDRCPIPYNCCTRCSKNNAEGLGVRQQNAAYLSITQTELDAQGASGRQSD
jgi:hypothetical protein